MPTVIQQPIDVQWVVILASLTSYSGAYVALAAAVTLSAANGNAPVQIAAVDQVVTAPTPAATQTNMPSGTGAPNFYVVQLQSASTAYPLEQARVTGYALSAANAGAPVNLCRVIAVVTAP